MSCIHLPDHIATIITFLCSNSSNVALVLKVLRVMSTQSQSHAQVQCIVLKCPEWEERSTQEVHKRSTIGLFRCYSEFHGKNQSSDNIILMIMIVADCCQKPGISRYYPL